MLKYLVFLTMFVGYGEAVTTPLHEEDAHFIQYKVLQIDQSLTRIEKLLSSKDIGAKRKDKIYREIDMIRYNLGLSDGHKFMICLGD